MGKLGRIVLVAVLMIGGLIIGQGYCSSQRPLKSASDVVRIVGVGGNVSQKDIDEAWKSALEIGGGDPTWVCPVTSDRVIIVPSSLIIGTSQFYGITNFEPAMIGNRMELVMTVEIHLPDNLRCHAKQVLIHELLHIVLTRRELTDPTYAAQEDRVQGRSPYKGQEGLVRVLYPVEMGLCSQ